MYPTRRVKFALKEILILTACAAIGLVIAFALNTFVLISARVTSGSMYAAIPPQSRVFGIRTPFAARRFDRGDIVVVASPLPDLFSEPVVKRIVGLPGEQIAIISGIVHIDGVPLHEYYLADTATQSPDFAPFVIPNDHFFIMGDNRLTSRDSRHWGAVCATTIIGRIIVINTP